MDANELLKQDHQAVKQLFREFESAREGSPQQKQQLADKIFMELEVHSKIEDEIYYPAVREKEQRREGKSHMVAEAVEEHHVVDLLISEIRELEPSDEAFTAKMTVLIENVEHHIEEEETEMLPESEEILGQEMLQELGAQMEERKQELMQEMESKRSAA